MKTLKETIIDVLDDSRDCIDIIGYGRNCDHEIQINSDRIAENIIAAEIDFFQEMRRMSA